MIKTKLNRLNIDIYEEELSNKLKIYIVKNENKNGIYVTFNTKYGSNINEFVPIGEEKFIKVPDGVAHFLEHKVFEQEDGVDPFSVFSENGSDCNANTSNDKTTYLFSCTNYFEENLKLLLNYVTSPYFTDENVLKEKGIIEQEIKMYDDDPSTKLYERILHNSFCKHNIRIPIGGTVKSINKIDKEILYKCYNTFYHPSNMFIVITGNVDVEKTINLIKSFYNTKKYKDSEEIKIKKYNEPDNVYKEMDNLKFNVDIPKVSVNYKLNITNSNIDLYKKVMYLNILLNVKLSSTSLFLERLRKENIINEDLSYDIIYTDKHALILIAVDSYNKDKVVSEIKTQMLDLSITKEELERKKKTLISSLVYMSDNIYSINHKIVNNIIKYGDIIYNNYDLINSLNIDEYNDFINSLDFSNINITIIEPK